MGSKLTLVRLIINRDPLLSEIARHVYGLYPEISGSGGFVYHARLRRVKEELTIAVI